MPKPDEPRVHELKCQVPWFADVVAGLKTWEVRLDDRTYRVGDVLHLHEYRADFGPEYGPTGRACSVRVHAVWYGVPGLKEGYVVLGIEPCGEATVPTRPEAEVLRREVAGVTAEHDALRQRVSEAEAERDAAVDLIADAERRWHAAETERDAAAEEAEAFRVALRRVQPELRYFGGVTDERLWQLERAIGRLLYAQPTRWARIAEARRVVCEAAAAQRAAERAWDDHWQGRVAGAATIAACLSCGMYEAAPSAAQECAGGRRLRHAARDAALAVDAALDALAEAERGEGEVRP